MRSQCDLSVESSRGGAHETPLDLRFPSLAKLNDFNPSPANISSQPQTLFENNLTTFLHQPPLISSSAVTIDSQQNALPPCLVFRNRNSEGR
jgi:hypothetical protein